MPSRFQTFRPGAPPPPEAAAAVPPFPVPRPVLAGTEDYGTGTCAPAARGLLLPPSGLSLPRGGRMWAPRGRPEPSGPEPAPVESLPEPRAAGGRGRGLGGRTQGPARAAGRGRAAPRAGRGGGGRLVLTGAAAVHPGAGALRAGGSWRAGGWAPASHPPSRRGCGATVRRGRKGGGREGEGPGSPAGRVG